MTQALTDAQLKAAIKARDEGKPLPSGVNWSAHREPQFLSLDEFDEFEKTGGIPEGARGRILTERKLLAAFDARGGLLEGKAKADAIEGIEPNEVSVQEKK